MASLSEAKTLGGVGSILILLGFVPFLGIVGWILVLVAIKYISDSVRDRSIYDNAIWAVILVIIALVATSLFILLPFVFNVALFPTDTIDPLDPVGLFLSVWFIAGLVVGWIFSLIAAIFLKRSYDSIAVRVSVPMFGTTGLLFLIGFATLIVLVGFLILFIAEILQIVAFFSIPDQPPQAAPTATPPPPSG